jgi:hypothetical protein
VTEGTVLELGTGNLLYGIAEAQLGNRVPTAEKTAWEREAKNIFKNMIPLTVGRVEQATFFLNYIK